MDASCEDHQAAYLGDDDERATAIAHLQQCPTCGPMRAELDDVRSMLADSALWDEPSVGLEGSILRAIEVETARAGETTAIAEPAAAPVISLDAERARRRRLRDWAPAAVVGAAAALAAVVVAGTLDREPGADVTVAMAATDLAPDARATADIRSTPSGFEIELDVDGLSRPDEGGFYQAWIEGPNGLVTIGTFHTGEGETVVLWSGVDPVPGAKLTVTLEPDDGDPASSGQRVLTATLPR